MVALSLCNSQFYSTRPCLHDERRNCSKHRENSTAQRTTTHLGDCTPSSSVQHAPGKKTRLSIYNALVRTGLDTSSRPTSIETDALSTRLRDKSATFLTNYKAVLPILRFSREFGLIFCVVAGFFQDLRVACFWGCFS